VGAVGLVDSRLGVLVRPAPCAEEAVHGVHGCPEAFRYDEIETSEPRDEWH
jgi:hypothetical protein